MAKGRNIKRKSNKKPNSFLIFIVVVIVLALVSFGISYLVLDKDKETGKTAADVEESIVVIPNDKQGDHASDKETLVGMAQLAGTWVSNYDGTMLTIQGSTCVLESPAVDSPEKVSGTIMVNKSIVTFVFTDKHSCGSTEGHYEYQMEGDGGVFFRKIKDDCKMRTELMSASWFRL